MVEQNNKNKQSRSHNLYYKLHVNKLCLTTSTYDDKEVKFLSVTTNVQKDPRFFGARSNAFFYISLLIQVLKSILERFRKQITSVS